MRVWGFWSAWLCPPIQHCVHVLCGFPSVFVSFVCLLSSAQSVLRLPGLCGPVAWAVEQDGVLGEGEGGSFSNLMPVTPWAFQKPVLRVLV